MSKPTKPQYFGVIGNRDYIKIQGEARPFWEFLDEQPDGWLTSLAYRRKDLPQGRPMIYDCGAWSYRNEEIPPIDSKSVAAEYLTHAPEGSCVIAPDHMLIDGTNIEYRRKWNAEQAARFLDDCPRSLVPMACIHGMTIEERVANARWLFQIGYRRLAIGGLAARASQKTAVVDWVSAIRQTVPEARLHVLGLSSPSYMQSWRDIGIESADGSSHFKQAFTAGAFFVQDGARLRKYQARRPCETETLAPACGCAACSVLRAEGVDTRSFGSNQHNMGRAAHNLNALMRAQKAAMRRTLVLVACCGEKLKGVHAAGDTYQSALFHKARQYAIRNGDAWGILSAKYGLLSPDTLIHDYDVTLNGMTGDQRSAWANQVREQLASWKRERIILLAGSNYCDWVTGEFEVERPMEGLGIGRQLQYLNSANIFEESTQLTLQLL